MRYFVSDFETVTGKVMKQLNKDYTKVLLAVTSELIDIPDDQRQYHIFSNIHDWFEYLISYKENLQVYFHNLSSFDGYFIIPYLESHGYEVSNDYELTRHRQYRIFQFGNQIYNIEVNFRFRNNKQDKQFKINFYCSYKLLSTSVENLGKAYDIKKHHDDDGANFYDVIPQDNIQDYSPRFIEYAKNDVLIVIKSLIDLNKTINSLNIMKHHNMFRENEGRKHDNILFKNMTITGVMKKLALYQQAYYNRVGENKHPKRKLFRLDVNTYEITRQLMAGGFSQFNPKYQSKDKPVIYKNCLMIDVTSAYPYAMTKPLPFGKVLYEKPKNHNYLTFYHLQISKAKIKPGMEGLACLKNWKKNESIKDALNPSVADKLRELKKYRYLYELDDFDCYYWKEEWDALNRIYDFEIISKEEMYMKCAPFMKSLEEDLFKQKQLAEIEGNKARRQAIKILLNSGYGMMAMKLQYPNTMYFKKGHEPKVDEDGNFVVDDKIYKRKNCYEEKINPNIDTLTILKGNQENKEIYSGTNIAAASYITAFQRARMINMIIDVGVQWFAYGDTDSCIFVNLPDDVYDRIVKSTNDELGGWKVEYNRDQFDGIHIFKIKTYTLTKDGIPIKERSAGVNALSAKDIYLEFCGNDEFIVKNASFQRQLVKGGIILVPKDKKLKRGNI